MRNMVKVNHDFDHPELWAITAAKQAAMGAAGKKVYYVPCWSCVRKIASGEIPPPHTHKCRKDNQSCVELWSEAERVTGYQHSILRR